MRRPGGWWRRKSTPAKVETYTRWSFHFFGVIEIATVGLATVSLVGPPPVPLFLTAVCAHGALSMLTASRAVDWMLGRRARPVRLLWALGALSAAVAVAALAVTAREPRGSDLAGVGASVAGSVLIFGAGFLALGLRGRREVAALVVGFSLGAGCVAALVGMPAGAAFFMAAWILAGAALLAVTSMFSGWLLNAVFALDEARETRARLAVAEERLRFGRDLHDVLGRNLAVIALKSELAVQLARRERPEAVEQMVEVQRIAQASQREVRDVVRGYREADLEAELAGARGVLAAAGIDCQVTGRTTGLPARVQSALGWVVREATTNVLRHGDATWCAVTVRTVEGRVVLTVENDGAGPEGTGRAEAPPDGRGPAADDPRAADGTGRGTAETAGATGPAGAAGTAGTAGTAGAPPSGGSGLAGLRERLAAVDGRLTAGRIGGGRFRLTAEVPLTAGGHPAEAAS
ncbi:sensor histidine kinase [Streptomyces sp. bgisy022]|uniref:sensor histidine kinase n=1 Tax=Streptomyces sp. bgisy022 TaxID=3413769 RepID=UPI003D727D62